MKLHRLIWSFQPQRRRLVLDYLNMTHSKWPNVGNIKILDHRFSSSELFYQTQNTNVLKAPRGEVNPGSKPILYWFPSWNQYWLQRCQSRWCRWGRTMFTGCGSQGEKLCLWKIALYIQSAQPSSAILLFSVKIDFYTESLCLTLLFFWWIFSINWKKKKKKKENWECVWKMWRGTPQFKHF